MISSEYDDGIPLGAPAGIPSKILEVIPAGIFLAISTGAPLVMYSEIAIDFFLMFPVRITPCIYPGIYLGIISGIPLMSFSGVIPAVISP